MTLYDGDKICLPSGCMTVHGGRKRPARKRSVPKRSTLAKTKPQLPGPRHRGVRRKLAPKRAKVPEMRVTVTFGVQKYRRIPFMQAVEMIHNATVVERKHFELFTRFVNGEQWVIAGISKALSGAKPPSNQMWEKPLKSLIRAMAIHQAAYQYVETRPRPQWYTQQQWRVRGIKDRLHSAKWALLGAVSDYNKVHKAWYSYRDHLGQGAEAGKLLVQITIEILSMLVSAGVGGRLASAAAQGLARRVALKKAATAMGLSVYKDTAQAASSKLQGIEEVDYKKIALNGILAAVFSRSGDLLSDVFLKVLKPTQIVPGLARLQYTQQKKALAEFFGDKIGNTLLQACAASVINAYKDVRKRKAEDVFKAIIDEMRKKGMEEALKAFLRRTGKI